MGASHERIRAIDKANKRAERRKQFEKEAGPDLIAKHYRKEVLFVRYSIYVLESDALKGLTPMARSVLDAFAIAEYPCRNGWLVCSRSVIKQCAGTNSDDTAHRIFKELLARGLVVLTRAARGRAVPLCALTWLPLNRAMNYGDDSKLDWPKWTQWMMGEPPAQEKVRLHSPVGRRPKRKDGKKQVPPHERRKAPKEPEVAS